MFHSFRRRVRTVAALAVAAALTVGGMAVAQGGSGKSDSGKSGAAKGKRMPPPPGGPLGGPAGKNLTYAELHVQRNGQAEVIRLDSGKITAVSDSSITVEENDGNEVTVAVDGQTKVLAGPGRDTAVSDLKTGQQVIVSGPEGETAKAIMLPPKHGKKGGRRHGQMPPPGGQHGGPQGGPPQMQG